jgi:hypothetical protein
LDQEKVSIVRHSLEGFPSNQLIRFGQGAKLHGLIYLHDIHENGLDQKGRKFIFHSQALQDLLHGDWLSRIVFVSSFWAYDYRDPATESMSAEVMKSRENQFRDNYWHITNAHMTQYGKNGKGAKEILYRFLSSIL